jgi:hypothetical protein
MSEQNAVNAQENSAPLQITISGVLSLLSQGKNRKEIAEHYGKTQTEMNLLVWSHPKLKGRKVKKQYTGIELVDLEDEEEVQAQVETTQEEVVQEENAPTLNTAFAEEEIPADQPQTNAQYVDGAMVGSTSTEDWK